MEDAEQVTVAFLVATAALGQGKQVVMWATKEAVRLGLPGTAQGVGCKGCPPLERLFEQFTDGSAPIVEARTRFWRRRPRRISSSDDVPPALTLGGS